MGWIQRHWRVPALPGLTCPPSRDQHLLCSFVYFVWWAVSLYFWLQLAMWIVKSVDVSTRTTRTSSSFSKTKKRLWCSRKLFELNRNILKNVRKSKGQSGSAWVRAGPEQIYMNSISKASSFIHVAQMNRTRGVARRDLIQYASHGHSDPLRPFFLKAVPL